jgi:uncharacterized protein YbcI
MDKGDSSKMRAEISNAVVGLHRDYFGKGPTRAKTYIHDNLVLCVLENGATTVEQTLRTGGRGDEARAARVGVIQDTAEDALKAKVEQLTQQKVEALVGGHNPEEDVTTLVFLLES